MAPLVRLLHPLGKGVLGGKAREHGLGALPARDVEPFERLVREVEDVPAPDVTVIGGGGEEHVRELRRPAAGANCRDEAALGALGVSYLYELAEPGLERRQRRV